uniref:Mitochondrial fission process protein 1 n=1 Tax=Panagrellus redivivus TaxID=6233 RepID=A0A7E4UMY5_PANRE
MSDPGLIERERKDIDLYRDTPIRFLGYANEVGEAFRAIVPVSAVKLSYVVAVGYVLADTLDKSHKVSQAVYPTQEARLNQVLTTAGDTVLWQGFASVIIPGITINRLCASTSFLLRRLTAISPPLVKGITTAVGLSAIPFIVKPIDALVEVSMDRTVRQYYSHEKQVAVDVLEKQKEVDAKA